MKIQNNNRLDAVKIYRENKAKAEAGKENANKSFDTIEISKEAMEISKYVNIAKGLSDVRMDKVNHIKNRIQEGKYYVSAEELAAKILDAIKEGKENI